MYTSDQLHEAVNCLHLSNLTFAERTDSVLQAMRPAIQTEGDSDMLAHQNMPNNQYAPIGSEYDSEDNDEPEDTSKEGRINAMLHHAYVDRQEFNDAINLYVNRLHDTKQGKALITAKGYNTLLSCLLDPSDTSLIDAQYRHWAREGHRVLVAGTAFIIVDKHGLPLAVREQIYDVLSACHDATGHGGRDKTAAIVFSLFSGIPKELIGEFVRLCKCCQKLRPTGIDNSLAARDAEARRKREEETQSRNEYNMAWLQQNSQMARLAAGYNPHP